MIQIITSSYEKQKKYSDNKKYIISDFESPKSFDQYDVNIIDLSFDILWRNNNDNMNTINMIKDLVHYKKIIETAQSSKVLILFPQNIKFRSYYYGEKYHKSEDLKNLLKLVKELVIKNIEAFDFDLDFEKTTTKLENTEIMADFYFDKDSIDTKHSVLVSNKSQKITTIRVNTNLYYTTLDLSNSPEKLEEFLIKAKINNTEKLERPKWIEDVNILNDITIKEEVKEIDKVINEKQKEREKAIINLEKNNDIKSILYETDKNLQNQVIEILNEMLDYSDDNFIDEMEEDFRIKKENITFLIETKGLKRNIAGTDISKTFNHVLMYEEKIQDIDKKENVKGIFIVATQRDKSISEREETPDRQIKIAERNNILIIRTEQLLEIFEDFRNKKINTDDIINLLTEQNGELKYNKE